MTDIKIKNEMFIFILWCVHNFDLITPLPTFTSPLYNFPDFKSK